MQHCVDNRVLFCCLFASLAAGGAGTHHAQAGTWHWVVKYGVGIMGGNNSGPDMTSLKLQEIHTQ